MARVGDRVHAPGGTGRPGLPGRLEEAVLLHLAESPVERAHRDPEQAERPKVVLDRVAVGSLHGDGQQDERRQEVAWWPAGRRFALPAGSEAGSAVGRAVVARIAGIGRLERSGDRQGAVRVPRAPGRLGRGAGGLGSGSQVGHGAPSISPAPDLTMAGIVHPAHRVVAQVDAADHRRRRRDVHYHERTARLGSRCSHRSHAHRRPGGSAQYRDRQGLDRCRALVRRRTSELGRELSGPGR